MDGVEEPVLDVYGVRRVDKVDRTVQTTTVRAVYKPYKDMYVLRFMTENGYWDIEMFGSDLSRIAKAVDDAVKHYEGTVKTKTEES